MTAKGAAQFVAASSGVAPVPGHVGPPAQSETPGELPGLADSSELAKQVAGMAAAQEGITGARLWRLANGKLTIWEESGHLPPANEVLAEKALTNLPARETIMPTGLGLWPLRTKSLAYWKRAAPQP